ncbi:MAG: hypothetical protein EOM80_06250, partial [Erysipelotrichia bacterium]|nr:hypothetical protein [Erysipelotrichia bacterium]
MYLNKNKRFFRSEALNKGFPLINIFTWKKIPGKISLILVLLLGIFYPCAVSAVATRSVSVNATSLYVASFSFNSGEFAARQNIFPDRVFFNASGTTEGYTPLAYSSDYPPWAANYTAGTWSLTKTAGTFDALIEPSMQACQVHAGANAALSPGAILVSHMTLQLVDEPREILFNAYANEANLFTSPLPGFPRLVTSGTPSKPHAMVVSSTRVYFFWVAADKICARTFDGTDFTAVATFTNADTNATYGVSGCLVNAAGSEFIALTYATSNSAINIVSFKDSDFTNNGDFSITATTSLPIGIFDSTHVGITQNPRTGKMLLLWENAGVAKFRTGDFSAPGGTFSFSGETTFGAGFEKTFGVALSGFENFENSFVLPHDLDGQEKHYLLKEPAAVSLHSMLPDIPDIGYAVLFPYTASGKKYAGLINLSSYYKFDFYRRPLEYPSTCSWQNPDKTLHIQGPPMSGTTVRAEVYFAEVLPASSLANLVNTGGNRAPFNGQTGVIASNSGNIYSIKFDKDMKQADFEGLINNAVKMLDDGDITVPLTYVGSSSREIFFRSSSDLALNKTYRILVASSVIDANGSQIYEDATLSFTTQN